MRKCTADGDWRWCIPRSMPKLPKPKLRNKPCHVVTVVADLQSLRGGAGGRPLPSARLVSSTIAEDRNVSHNIQSLWLMVWGQFIDHDLSHTALSKDVLHPSGMQHRVLFCRMGGRRGVVVTRLIQSAKLLYAGPG